MPKRRLKRRLIRRLKRKVRSQRRRSKRRPMKRSKPTRTARPKMRFETPRETVCIARPNF